MTFDQVIAKLAELSAQCVTKPDNAFAKMAESLQFHAVEVQDLKQAIEASHGELRQIQHDVPYAGGKTGAATTAPPKKPDPPTIVVLREDQTISRKKGRRP